MSIKVTKYIPDELVYRTDRVEVSLVRGAGEVKIDGHPIRGIQKLTLVCEGGKEPVVTLELFDTPPPRAAGDDTSLQQT